MYMQTYSVLLRPLKPVLVSFLHSNHISDIIRVTYIVVDESVCGMYVQSFQKGMKLVNKLRVLSELKRLKWNFKRLEKVVFILVQ